MQNYPDTFDDIWTAVSYKFGEESAIFNGMKMVICKSLKQMNDRPVLLMGLADSGTR